MAQRAFMFYCCLLSSYLSSTTIFHMMAKNNGPVFPHFHPVFFCVGRIFKGRSYTVVFPGEQSCIYTHVKCTETSSGVPLFYLFRRDSSACFNTQSRKIIYHHHPPCAVFQIKKSYFHAFP